MNGLTRRRLLQWAGAGAVASAAAGIGWQEVTDRARHDPLPSKTGILVVTLYGGNDGLNMVIPAGDPVYRSLRPHLAYAEEEVLPLADGLGLNPGMPGLKRHWDAGRLAIVPGVGYPKPDHSHFRSMDIWQTASPERPVLSGWIGRWLDATGGDPLRAISMEPMLPLLMAGERTAGVSLPLGGLTLPSGSLGTALAAMGAGTAEGGGAQAAAARSLADLGQVSKALASAVDPKQTPALGADWGGGPLAKQLDAVARCVEMGAPGWVYSVSLGGFDTHVDGKATQQRLLEQVDAAVAGFLDRMLRSDRGRQVVLMAYSEFGRRVAANATQGTDHGTAGPVFVAGTRVRGAVVGAPPSLTDLDNGDLKPTADLRDIYAALLAQGLGVDSERFLGVRQPIPLLRS